jgi:hypothetical protein
VGDSGRRMLRKAADVQFINHTIRKVKVGSVHALPVVNVCVDHEAFHGALTIVRTIAGEIASPVPAIDHAA